MNSRESKFVDVLILTSSNMFLDEHVLPSEHMVASRCNYSGSNGILIIRDQHKTLLTDSRYDIVNPKESYGVDEFFIIPRDAPSAYQVILSVVKEGERVGMYGDNVPAMLLQMIEREASKKFQTIKRELIDLGTEKITELSDAKTDQISPKSIQVNTAKQSLQLVLRIFSNPSVNPSAVESSLESFLGSVHTLDLSLTGCSAIDKMAAFVSYMIEKDDSEQYFAIVPRLSQISWLLNVRGRGSADAQTARGILTIHVEPHGGSSMSGSLVLYDAKIIFWGNPEQFDPEGKNKLLRQFNSYSVVRRVCSPFYERGLCGEFTDEYFGFTFDIKPLEQANEYIFELSEDIREQIKAGQDKQFEDEQQKKKSKISYIFDMNSCNALLYLVMNGKNALTGKDKQDDIQSRYHDWPLIDWMSQKHPNEVECARLALAKEAGAFANFIADTKLHGIIRDKGSDEANPTQMIFDREAELTQEITRCQEKAGSYMPSFSPIVGINEHSSLVHYDVFSQASKHVKASLCLEGSEAAAILCDAGGQYKGALTDTTRTFIVPLRFGHPVGSISQAFRLAYTAVLRAVIAFSTLKFDPKTPIHSLDSVVRLTLQSAPGGPYSFGHGTGHGVGAGLDVHEGTFSVNWTVRPSTTKTFRPGILVTIEPGVYLLGRFGIRIENILHVRESIDSPGCLEFETLTYIPFDRECIDVTLLNSFEKKWIDEYHAKVLAICRSRVEGQFQNWLEMACAPL